MNLWGFTPAVFDQIEEGFREFLRRHKADGDAEYLLPDLVRELLDSRCARVRVLRTDAPSRWIGLTHQADAARAAALLRQLTEAGEYPAEPWR
jgi:hypothetical protein